MKRALRLVRSRVVTSVVDSVLSLAAATLSLLASVPASTVSPTTARQVSAAVSIAPGMRLVGVGHAAVAVPLTWGTNQRRCGTPKVDTVVIDVAGVNLCGTFWPAGVESVELVPGKPWALDSIETVTIDGTVAHREPTTCPRSPYFCSGAVYLPAEDVTFLADSSTGPEQVDQILDRIRVVPGLVAVPGWQRLATSAGGNALEQYLEALEKASLNGVVARPPILFRGGGPRMPDDRIYNVSPAPGTMLLPGQTVVVSVTAPALLDAPPL